MTVPELIQKYSITLRLDGNLSVAVPTSFTEAERNAVITELRSKKPDIVAHLQREKEEQERKRREREEKINAIPGLKELQSAREDMAAWQEEFDRSFDDVGGLGVRPRPQYDFQAMREKYPAAAAYLRAKHEADSANYELSDIGHRALEGIIADYTQYAAVMERMDAEIEAFTDRHMWD